MEADGGSIQQLTDDPAHERYPDWSPDGNQLVFFSDKTGNQELFVIARENKDSEWGIPRQLTFDRGHRGRWSPDGRFIAYISGNSVLVISPNGGDSRVLISSQDPAILPVPQFPEWSQNGKEVYYKALDAEGRSSFWSMPVAGGEPKLLVRFDDSSRKSNRPEFATDGSCFYFTLAESRCDLWVMDLLTNKQP
jgi:TolB protein